jgi:predicted permease
MLTHAWRSLRAAPRLTFTAVLCAALGLGAAIFMTSIASAVFATPPLPDAGRLVRVWTSATATGETSDLAYQDVLDIRARAGSFDAVESASRTRVAHTNETGTERIRGESVTAGYFDLVGIRPARGRLFDAAEYTAEGPRAVIISHALWLRRYGGRADIVGQPFRTRPTSRQGAETMRTVVGVMPDRFAGTVDPDVSEFWIPVAQYEPAAQLNDRMVRATWVLARLRPGATLTHAHAEIQALAAELAVAHPAAFDRVTLVAEPFGESWRERFRLSVLALLSASGALLLIACANVAALLMARLADRERELSVRLALGASRAHLRQQLFLESLLIAAAGGVAGLAVAFVSVRAFAASGLFAMPAYITFGVDTSTAITGIALVFVTAILFAIGPVRQVTRARAEHALQSAGTRTTGDPRQRRHGRLLVVSQVALTFVMLAGAALLFRTHQNLVRHDPGFRTTGLLRMAVTPDAGVFSDRDARLALAADIKRTFDAHPGVRRSTVMSGVLPPWFDDTVDAAAGPAIPMRDIGYHRIGPDFFETMDMRVLGGRGFDLEDRASGARGAIISQALARQLEAASGREALGQSLRLTTPGMAGGDDVEIVGIVNDVIYNGPLRARPVDHDIYVPIERGMPGTLSVAIQTSVDPSSLAGPLSRELGRLAPTSPQHWISTMEEELSLQFRDARLYAWLSGIYGATAVALAVLGVYSVLAHSVTRRRHEFGVRMAVGATSADILRLVAGEGARTIAAGVFLGVISAVWCTRLLGGLLFGIPSTDPITYVSAGILLAVAGLAAVIVPAWRASRMKPGVSQ